MSYTDSQLRFARRCALAFWPTEGVSDATARLIDEPIATSYLDRLHAAGIQVVTNGGFGVYALYWPEVPE